MNHTSRPMKKHFTVSMSEALHNYIMNNEMWSVLEINLVNVNVFRGGAAYLYLISILIWPHFDTYPYISIQNILMRAQNILITKIYL